MGASEVKIVFLFFGKKKVSIRSSLIYLDALNAFITPPFTQNNHYLTCKTTYIFKKPSLNSSEQFCMGKKDKARKAFSGICVT